MASSIRQTAPTLAEIRAEARELRVYFSQKTQHLKLMANLTSVAIEPRHQLSQLVSISKESLEVVDDFFETVEHFPDTKKNRHQIVHVRGEARNIRQVLTKFHQQLQATQEALMAQLNSPTRTSTGTIEFEALFGLFDFVINLIQVGGDYAKARNQNASLRRIRKPKRR